MLGIEFCPHKIQQSKTSHSTRSMNWNMINQVHWARTIPVFVSPGLQPWQPVPRPSMGWMNASRSYEGFPTLFSGARLSQPYFSATWHGWVGICYPLSVVRLVAHNLIGSSGKTAATLQHHLAFRWEYDCFVILIYLFLSWVLEKSSKPVIPQRSAHSIWLLLRGRRRAPVPVPDAKWLANLSFLPCKRHV